MPLFNYTVKDKRGETHKNTINYSTQKALIDHLQKQGFFVVNIIESTYKKIAKKKVLKRKRKQLHRKKIILQDLLVFSRQLTTMLEAKL